MEINFLNVRPANFNNYKNHILVERIDLDLIKKLISIGFKKICSGELVKINLGTNIEQSDWYGIPKN